MHSASGVPKGRVRLQEDIFLDLQSTDQDLSRRIENAARSGWTSALTCCRNRPEYCQNAIYMVLCIHYGFYKGDVYAGIPKSQVVREAIGEYSANLGRLSEEERERMLRVLDEALARIPMRPQEEVEREIREVRDARRAGGRKTESEPS